MKEHFVTRTNRCCKCKYGFSSIYKYSAAEFSDCNYVLGAPEFVLREQYEEYQSQVEELSLCGKRVLVFGEYKGKLTGKNLISEVIPMAFITFANPIRENAKQTFKYFAEQEVCIKVISGDNPLTVSQIAKEAGIEGAEKYVDATSIKNSKQLIDALKKYTVFGRVTPEQKRKIVHCLQKLGNTVAMTGDGVNDVLALKDADCSVAMASGSEAASQVAQVVLLDNDFSKMPSVVLEGRRVVNNIQRSAGLFFVKNIFSFILSILSLVFMFSYPLEPSQISFISMFTIGIPGFFLALEPDKSRIEGRFLPNVMKKAIPGGMADVFGVGALVFCGKAFHLNNADISTAATLLLSVIGFMVLFKVSRPMNTLRMVVLIGNMIALVLTGVFFNHLFALEAMSLECILLFIMFSFAAESFLRYLEKFVDWCYSVIKKRNYKKANNI
jgi:cation-transporting ATPase E